jgi:hypothetical protein
MQLIFFIIVKSPYIFSVIFALKQRGNMFVLLYLLWNVGVSSRASDMDIYVTFIKLVN